MLMKRSNAALTRQEAENDRNTCLKGALLWGGDRVMVLLITTLSVLSMAIRPSVGSVAAGAVFWVTSLCLLRAMARVDPLLRPVYLRSRRYLPTRRSGLTFSESKSGEGAQRVLADFVQYESLRDGSVLVTSTGELVAAWKLRAIEGGSLANEARLICAQGLCRRAALEAGWCLHFDVVRRRVPDYLPVSTSSFPDALTQAIDDERRQQFERDLETYESFSVLTVSWLPETQRSNGTTADRREQAMEFEARIAAFEHSLSAGFKLKRLGRHAGDAGSSSEDLVDWLQLCVGESRVAERRPESGSPSADTLGQVAIVGGSTPRIGMNHIQVLALRGHPDEIPALQQGLKDMSGAFRWSTRFDADRPPHNRAFCNVETGKITSSIILLDQNKATLAQQTKETVVSLRQLGIAPRVEDLNTIDAFLGSLPGQRNANVRKMRVRIDRFAEAMCVEPRWHGSPKAPQFFDAKPLPALMQCRAPDGSVVYLNTLTDFGGHMLLVGPSGAGKSTHLNVLAAQLRRYPSMSVQAITSDLSMYPLAAGIRAATRGESGSHTMLSVQRNAHFLCPLQHLDSETDLHWAGEWIKTILVLNGLPPSFRQQDEILSALRRLQTGADRSLTAFLNFIRDGDVHRVIERYTAGGPLGTLLDGATDQLPDADFSVVALQEVISLGDTYSLPVLLHLLKRLERRLDGRPTAILLDDSWQALLHPAVRANLRAWINRVRLMGGTLILTMQSLGGIESGMMDDIIDGVTTKIVCPDPTARWKAAAYKRLGLSDLQIEHVVCMLPRRHYLVSSGNGWGCYSLELGELARCFCASSSTADVRTIQDLEESAGYGWIADWLRERGVTVAHGEWGAGRAEDLTRGADQS
jgi:type IV secretory pathway VirB4 component/type IV secretory pathway TrbD component